ncbi:TPA: hypothetical protein ACH3X1_016226 [Trebouxia sp. C0004]
MDADLSDEDFLIPSTQLNFPLRMPSLAQEVADAKLDSDRQHTGTPPSSDKPARPKRRYGNAQIFDDSEGEDAHESDLDKPVAKRLRQVPVEVQEAEELQEISEPDVILRRRRMHVQADAEIFIGCIRLVQFVHLDAAGKLSHVVQPSFASGYVS